MAIPLRHVQGLHEIIGLYRESGPFPHLSSLIAPLFRWLGRLSLPTLHRIGGAAGLLFCALSPHFRKRIAGNMARALGRQPTTAEIRSNAMETACMMFDLPYVWQRPLAKVLGHVIEVRGWDRVEALRARGEAMIILTPHLGCFEIISAYVGEHMPMTVLYRKPKQAAMEPLMIAGRKRGAIKLAPADLSGVRGLIRALRHGEAVGMLPDQAPGNGEGLWSPFFGKAAYTMTLAARLTEVQNTHALIFWGERVRGRGWRIHISEPQEPITGTLEERVHAINRNMETVIRECPSQYLWSYNRYKVPAGATPPAEESAAS